MALPEAIDQSTIKTLTYSRSPKPSTLNPHIPAANFFLPIAFAQFVVEWPMSTDVCPMVFGPAAITDKHVWHHHIQNHVQHRKTHQNSDGQDWAVIQPGDAAGQSSHCDKQQSQTLWKVFLSPQVRVSTAEALVGNRCVTTGVFGERAFPVAMCTL